MSGQQGGNGRGEGRRAWVGGGEERVGRGGGVG